MIDHYESTDSEIAEKLQIFKQLHDKLKDLYSKTRDFKKFVKNINKGFYSDLIESFNTDLNKIGNYGKQIIEICKEKIKPNKNVKYKIQCLFKIGCIEVFQNKNTKFWSIK